MVKDGGGLKAFTLNLQREIGGSSIVWAIGQFVLPTHCCPVSFVVRFVRYITSSVHQPWS